MELQMMTEKSLAIGVISMQLSDFIERKHLSFEQAAEINRRSGWLVIFPVEGEGGFRRKRVTLDESSLTVAWSTAQKLHGPG